MIETNLRAVSLLSVASAVAGGLAIGAFLSLALWPLTVVGIVLAVLAIRHCARYEQIGSRAAWAGLVVSSITLVAAPTRFAILYSQETFPGYLRVHFDNVTRENAVGLAPFVGQRICLKGYAYPEKSPEESRGFRMTPAGGNLIKERFVGVQLAEGQSWNGASGPLSVSGVLVRNRNATSENKAPPFLIQQGIVRPAWTSAQLAPRASGGC